MADGFIVRKGGVATEQALAPTITQVATTETSITFSITNNDAQTAIIRHRLDDITDEGVIVELATNATSENITVTTLTAGTEFTVFATANVTGKVKSNVTQLAIFTNEIPAPTITLVSKTDTSVTFTLKNNSVETRDVTFGLTTPPTTTTISLASDATSGDQTFSNLDPDTFITLFAQAEGGLIGQLNVTTDPGPVFTAATGGTTLEYDSGGKRFRSHTFTSSGNFVVSTVGDNEDDLNKVDYLIIAGGGGSNIAGTGFPGGGGAGGFVISDTTVSLTSYTITVGLGGVVLATQGAGGSGQNSSAFGDIANGGGGGGNSTGANSSTFHSNGGNGGSGGGAGGFGNGARTGGTGISGQGFKGGDKPTPGWSGPGGGGGATQAGQNGEERPNASPPGKGGNGGNGIANTFRNGTSETRAGGGGSTPNGTGGLGGGGNGKNGQIAQAGAANTGGGGAGGGYNTTGDDVSQPGGSGIVIIRYEIASNV